MSSLSRMLVYLFVFATTGILIPAGNSQQPGTPDPSFGLSGVVFTDFDGKSNYAVAVVVQPDAKILVCGNSTEMFATTDCHLVRYMPNGSYDGDFGTNGKVSFLLGGEDNTVYDMVLLSSGKILVTGVATDAPVKTFATAAFTASGEPDLTFGTNGITKTNFGHDAWALCVAEQDDGKILVGGMIDYGPGTDRDAVICRYLSNGTPDASFGTGGHVVVDLHNGSFDMPGDILFHDNRILLSSYAYNGNGSDYDAVAVVALTMNGTLDPLFGVGGITLFDGLTIDAGLMEPGTSMVTDANNRIAVAGWIHSLDGRDFALFRFLSNGYPDATFDGDGMVVTDMIGINAALALVIQPDQKLVAGGYHSNGTGYDFCIARYLTDGSLDAGFGTHFGVSFIPVALVTPSFDFLRGMALHPNGMLIATGEAKNAGGNTDFATIRCFTGLPPVALEEESGSDPGIILYPNPLQESQLSVKTVGIQNQWVHIRLIQANGKVVANWNTWVGNDASYHLLLPLPEGVNRGVYTVLILGGENIIYSGSLIVH